MYQNIAIIGAGFAGLSAARHMKDFGYNVTVFEKAPDVGGVWSVSRRYPKLSTQNNKDSYCLSEFPMPKSYPEWPSGKQVQEYLEAYTKKFNIDENIMLNTEVVKAELDPSQKFWTVTSVTKRSDGTEVTETRQFDFLIVANGIFSTPKIPDYKGADAFQSAGGRICHTSQFTNLDDAIDKDIVLVGYGKSTCDLAVGICEEAKSTTIVVRNLIWKMPKHIMNVLNFKHLLLTRMGEALFPYIRLKGGAEKFLHGIGKPVRNSMLGSLEGAVARQCKLKKLGLHPGKPLETIARSTVSLVTDGFFKLVEKGKIAVKRDLEIAELRPGQAVLTNGEIIPCDVLACGTGWQQNCDFLSDEIMNTITDEEGNYRLWQTMLPVHVPRIAFNGYNSSFFSPLSAEVGALWIIDYLKGGITLPEREEMDRKISERLVWMEERTEGKHARGTNIIPFSMHQIDEVLYDMNLNVGALTRAKQWLRPVNPLNYKKLNKKLKKKHKIV